MTEKKFLKITDLGRKKFCPPKIIIVNKERSFQIMIPN